MTRLDPYDWPLAALVAVLLALSLTPPALPAQRSASPETAVCEKPGLAALGFVLLLH